MKKIAAAIFIAFVVGLLLLQLTLAFGPASVAERFSRTRWEVTSALLTGENPETLVVALVSSPKSAKGSAYSTIVHIELASGRAKAQRTFRGAYGQVIGRAGARAIWAKTEGKTEVLALPDLARMTTTQDILEDVHPDLALTSYRYDKRKGALVIEGDDARSYFVMHEPPTVEEVPRDAALDIVDRSCHSFGEPAVVAGAPVIRGSLLCDWRTKTNLVVSGGDVVLAHFHRSSDAGRLRLTRLAPGTSEAIWTADERMLLPSIADSGFGRRVAFATRIEDDVLLLLQDGNGEDAAYIVRLAPDEPRFELLHVVY